jgi:hypothetical protein
MTEQDINPQPTPNAGLSGQMPRPGWIHLALLPQVRHIHPQVMRVLDRIGPPNLTQQLAMRHDPVGILHPDQVTGPDTTSWNWRVSGA